MDPDACLKRLLEALDDEDREEAIDAMRTLLNWTCDGGFLPTVNAVVPDGTFEVGA